MSKRLGLRATLAFCVCLPALACGEVADDLDERPPLTSVRGTVSMSTAGASTEHPLNIAVVWVGSEAHLVAVETPIKPEFPARFSLNLDAPPPQQVMVTAEKIDTGAFKPATPGEFGFALGIVVAYEDLNGNGKLDMIARGAPAFIDRLAGYVESHLVFYGEGNAPAELSKEFGGPVPRGYSLLKVNPSDDVDASTYLGFVNTAEELALLLDEAAHDERKEIMCQQFPDETETVNTARTASELPTVFPSAGYTFNDAERREEFVTCAENGRSYVHRTCMIKAKEALCSGLLETCESVTYALPEGANPPAGYPCNAIP